PRFEPNPNTGGSSSPPVRAVQEILRDAGHASALCLSIIEDLYHNLSANAPSMTAARVIVPVKVYALGSSVPLDGRVSWAPATPGLRQACSCYLLTEGESALLVDTGVPAHWPAMEVQLRELVKPGTS